MPALPPHEKTCLWTVFRVTKDPQSKELQDFIQYHFKSYICAFETHSNSPHVHILCNVGLARPLEIVKLAKKQLGWSGNKDYSCSNVNPSTTPANNHELLIQSRYVCKGDAQDIPTKILFRSSDWHDQVVFKYKQEYWEIYNAKQKTIMDNFTQQRIRINFQDIEPLEIKAKKPKMNWTQRVIEEYAESYPDLVEKLDFYNDEHLDHVTKFILKKLGQCKKIFSRNKLVEFVNGFMNSLEARGFEETTVLQIRNQVRGV